MAGQNGLSKISGTLGNMNYFRRGEKYYSRKAGGGFSREAIKERESMRRVREFNDEFARCSAAKKAFRLALVPYIGDIKNRELHSNMMSLFLELKNLDQVNEVGQRKISEGFRTENGKQLINDFSFLPELNFSPEVAVIIKKGNLVELKIAAEKKKPVGAESYEVSCAVMECDFELGEFFIYALISGSFSSLQSLLPKDNLKIKKDYLQVLEVKYYEEEKLVQRSLKLIRF